MSGPDASDHAQVTPVPSAPERYRYRGPEGEFEFDAWSPLEAGHFVVRGGQAVEAVSVLTMRWAGGRAGQHVTDEDRARMTDALRAYYRSHGIPFELRHLSGEVEDETGQIRPGFRTALPRAEHSDGWSLTDLYMSRAFPDPEDYPPTIIYQGPEGGAEMTRRFELLDSTRREMGGLLEVREKVRRRVLLADTLNWRGDRAGQPMSDEDRARILDRVLSVYDMWGYAYVVRSSG